MKILVAIEIDETRLKRIGWALGNYADELTDQTECKDWIDATLRDAIDELPLPPGEVTE